MGLFDDIPDTVTESSAPAGQTRITVHPLPTRAPLALDQRSRDLAIRTVLGEAADEPDEGKVGVAAVLRNRLESGRWGDSLPKVITAPKQFEPWNTQEGRSRMFSYTEDSEPYQKAAAAVDAAFGQGTDPTGGMTHFYNRDLNAKLAAERGDRRAVPTWDNGQGQQIGRHTFFAPDGKVGPTDVSARGKTAGLFDDIPAATANQPQALPSSSGLPGGMGSRAGREGEPEKAPEYTMAQSGVRGALRGATGNFYEELLALGKAGERSSEDLNAVNERRAAAGLGPVDAETGNSLLSLVRGAYRYLNGDEQAKQKYDTGLAAEEKVTNESRAQNPGSMLTGEIGSAMAAPVGRALQAATLPGRVVRGAAVGAPMGAIYGAGDTPDNRVAGGAVGGAVGAAVGGALPVAAAGVEAAGRGIGQVAQPIIQNIRGIRDPEAEAARRVTAAIARDYQNGAPGLTAAEYGTAHQAGTPVAVMDIGGETTRGLARSAANTSPEGRAVLNRAISDRFETQGPRVVSWLNQTFHYPNAQAQQEAIDTVSRTVNRQAYARAYRDGDHGVWSPELERLTGSPDIVAAMREAATKGQSRAIRDGLGAFNPGVTFDNGILTFQKGQTGAPSYPTLQFWDYTKRALDDAANAARRTGRNEEAGVLGDLGRQLRGELDRQVPSFAQARAGAAHFFGAENALEAGQNFVQQEFNNGQVRQQLARMSPTERQLFQDGFVSRFMETIDKIGDRRNVLNQIAGNRAAREKLDIALGPQRARELEAALRIEGVMDLARGAVQGNSTTARQLAELGLAGGAYTMGTGGNVLSPDPGSMLNAALVYGAARGQRRIDERVSRRVAEMLASGDPRVLVRGIRIVANQGHLLDGLRNTDVALARVGAQQTPQPALFHAAGAGRADNQQPEVPRPPGQ
jgi:hypothetical protein